MEKVWLGQILDAAVAQSCRAIIALLAAERTSIAYSL